MKKKYSDCLSNLSFSSHSLVDSDTSHFAKHYHEHFEIYVLNNGECRYLIDETIYSILPGDIVLIPAFHIHQTSYDTPTHSRQLVYISNDSLPLYTDKIIEKIGHVYRNAKVTDEIKFLIKKVNAESIHPDYYSNYMVTGYLQLIWGILFRNHNDYINQYVCGNTYVLSVLKYIKKNYSSDITLGQTAKKYSMSPEHLSRIFKNETGMTFNHYLTDIRIKEAECLLIQTTMPIGEIAFAVGYNDSNYFTKKFKSIHKISPLQFRNQYQKAKIRTTGL